MTNDPRQEIYHDLHQGQLKLQEQQNYHSAAQLLGMAREAVQITSLLDVGCGLGTWLTVARSLGISDVLGVEGPWFDPKTASIDPEFVRVIDLEQRFSLGRRFDLVVCLEVAEHLSAAAAARFIESLVEHAEHILFSAAIPGQGGHHHVNEQFPDYWASLFARHGFIPLDLFRARIWKDDSILWWLRQNIMLFASEKAVAENEKLRHARDRSGPLSLVHPNVYLSRMQQAAQIQSQFQKVIEILNQGRVFAVVKEPGGNLRLEKLQ